MKEVKHNILNAKQHEREAHIVAQARREGAITVSTNMAGRGTDIVLGGNPESMARENSASRPRSTANRESAPSRRIARRKAPPTRSIKFTSGVFEVAGAVE